MRTLYAKLSLVLLAMLSVIAVLYLLLAFYTTGMYLKEAKQRLHRDLAANLVAENLLMTDGEINRSALEGVFHNLMVINPDIEVYLLDPEGGVLAYSAPPGKVKRERVSLDPVRAFLAGQDPLPITGDDPRGTDRSKIFSAHPIGGSGGPQGYLYIILGGEEYDTVLGILRASYIMRLSVWAVAGLLIFALAAGLVIFRLLTRRLRLLSSEMDRFRESDFTTPAALGPAAVSDSSGGGDEIDRLAGTFRDMSERIVEQVGRLSEADNLRRELVANVSHDLRTPLASMQGYIETLLMKEGRLTEDERRKYLETVAAHGDRLSRLVTELFELSRLNSRETTPEKEPFSLAELVHDVCQKYRNSAEGKGVELVADCPTDLPFVHADIGLVERVFVNLLDNALRFTGPGGSVTVALREADGRVEARVEDTGAGIPADELPYIFDRFHRAHGASGVRGGEGDEAREGTGLGLAITKRILELHDSSIRVESKVGSGTRFTFDLPRYNP